MADVPALAFQIFSGADGMTERQAALATLAHGDSEERVAALDIFYQRYRDNPLVLDKWFQVQAWSLRPDRSEEHTSELQSLMRTSSAVFCLKKQNTLRAHMTTPQCSSSAMP